MALRLIFASPLAIILLSILAASPADPAYAHERRVIGNYEIEVGFNEEPALAYETNGVFLSVLFYADGVPEEGEHVEGPAEEGAGEPVEGLEETIQAEVVVGGGADKTTLALEPIFEQHGSYVGHFIPTLVGDYTFRIFGKIEEEAIDESFSSGPETFASVEDVTDLQFPEKLPSNADLQASIDALDTGGSGTATVLAIIGIVVGGAGLAAAAYAISRRPA